MAPPAALDPSGTSGITLVVGLATLAALAFGRLPGLRLSRAVMTLAGAVVLVALGAVDTRMAWDLIDGEVIVLLFGLSVVNVTLADAGAFRLLTAAVTRSTLGPRRLLALLVLTVGALSALFLNDTVVLMLTPLVVRLARRLALPPLPYLLGLALAANAGSVATVTGNPQNVLVAVSAGLPYGRFLALLGPVALASLLVTIAVLLFAFRRELTVGASVDVLRGAHPWPEVKTGPLVFAGLVTAAMVAAFALGMPVALAAAIAATVSLLARGRGAGRLLRRVDYELLVLFAGLFVVVGAMASTDLPGRLLQALLPAGGDLLSLTAVTAALSTVVSNVPAVLMLLPEVGFGTGAAVGTASVSTTLGAAPWAGSDAAAATLAMASTLAGNLTLVASVANLIVAESARRMGVDVGFWAYARVGVPVTLLTIALGAAWLAFAA